MTWKKWDENTWYDTTTGHRLVYTQDLVESLNPTTLDRWIDGVKLKSETADLLYRSFNSEAEAREFIEEFIK